MRVHSVAIISLDGDVSLQFDDEPPKPRAPHIMDEIHPAPPQVAVRRSAEAEQLLASMETSFANRLTWRVVHVRQSQSKAWNLFLVRNTTTTPGQDLSRALHVAGLARTSVVTDVFSGAVDVELARDTDAPGHCEVAHAPFALGKDLPVHESLEQLARELNVDAFVISQVNVDRNSMSTTGPVMLSHNAEPDALGSLSPTAHASLLVVDACGRTIALVDGQSSATKCGLTVASESSDGEVCAIVDAASHAIDIAQPL